MDRKKIYNDFKITSPYTQSPLMRVFRSSVPPESDVFREHHHTAFEITMVLNGSGIYSTKKGSFRFSSGDIFYFSTDEFHWLKELYTETTFFNIHFEPRFIWSDNFGISNIELMRIFFSRESSSNRLDNSKEETGIIRNTMYNIETEFMKKQHEYKTMIKINLITILIELTRGYDGKLSDTISGNSRTLQLIEQTINYIDNNLSSNITLEILSDIAHMSKTYFSSQFRKLNGISPWEYITIKRIEKAIMYIENTSMTKLEIAEKCGFNNTANFYHAFRRVTGKTPSDYIT